MSTCDFFDGNNRLNTCVSWFVVLSAALYFFYIFIPMNFLNALNASLVREFNFSAQQVSSFYSSFSFGNVLFLFPAGILLDRYSIKNILMLAFVVAIISNFVFSFTGNFQIMLVSRFILGITAAFSFLSSIKLASRWFDSTRMALVVGVVTTMGMLGGMVAQTPMAVLTENFGWRNSVQLVSGLGLILLCLLFFIVRDKPVLLEKEHKTVENLQDEKVGFWRSLSMILSSKQNWFSGAYIGLVNVPLFVFGGIWGVPYLSQVHGFSFVQASAIVSMMFIGMAVGSPIAGLISDKLGLRKLPMVIGSMLSIVMLVVVMFAPTVSFMLESFLYFIFGMVIGCQVIGYPVISESNSPSITATATCIGSIMIMSGGLLISVYGWLLDKSVESSQVIGEFKIYALKDYMCANTMLLIGLIVAFVFSLMIKETFCKQLHD